MHTPVLSRRLLYTGITRAKQSLILIGNYDSLQKAIQNVNERKRKTTLKERILSA